MDELIKEYISDNFSPDIVGEIFEVIELAKVFGYETIDTELLNVINDIENLGHYGVIDTLMHIIQRGLDDILRSFTIALEDDCNFITKLAYIKTVIAIDQFEDADVCLNILDGDNTPVEKLAEIMGMVTGVAMEEYLIMTVHVGPALIDRIREYFTNQQQNNSSVPEELDADQAKLLVEKRQLFLAYRDFTHDEMGFANELFSVDYPFMLPFSHYMNTMKNKQHDMDHYDRVKTIMAFAIVCDSKEDIITVVRNNMDSLDENEIEAVALESSCRKKAIEFQTHLNKIKGMVQ